MANEKNTPNEGDIKQLDQKDLESASGAGFFDDVGASLKGAWEGAADAVVIAGEAAYHAGKDVGVGVAAAADFVTGDTSGASSKLSDINNDFTNITNDWLPYPPTSIDGD